MHRHCIHYLEEHRENLELKNIISQKDRKIEQKDRKIAELERRLQYYENHNSPPSANSLFWQKQKSERKKKSNGNNSNTRESKPGRKNGHKGISHSFKPSVRIEHGMDRCSKCGSSSISFKHKEYRLIVDVPEPQPYTVTQHIINLYHCNRCNSDVKPDVNIPEYGMLGKNLLAMVASLWSARLPVGKVTVMLKAIYDLKLSPATINNALLNAAESLKPFVNRVKSNINWCKGAGFDETGMSINGKKGWAWAAVSNNGKNAFITVEYSRGADVLERYFHTFDGIAVVDGWKAYSIFKQQRCWAHIIREADNLAARTSNRRSAELAESLKNLYHDIKSELKEHPPPNHKLYRRATAIFRKLLAEAARCRNDDLRKFVDKLRNAGSKLFTFIMHNVGSTNNDCERIIREVVIHRKIRGLLRNDKGMMMFGNIMTAFMTWKLRGLNPLEELRKYL